MSGVDNLQGIDYQISYSVLTLLEIIKNKTTNVDSIKFESLTEEEEDLNLIRCDGTKEYIQIKKKSEGYHWTPSEMKTIFEKFQEKDEPNISFKFVSNGGGNVIVTCLKKSLLNDQTPSIEVLNNFVSPKLDTRKLLLLLRKTTILTLEYSSSNIYNPSFIINQHIHDLLLSTSFYLSDALENVFNSLWKYVFDLSKATRLMKISDIVLELKEIGLNIANDIWFDLPNLDSFIGRKLEISEIKTALLNEKRVIVKGISGTGKTNTLAKLTQELYNEGKKVLWLELNSILTYKDVMHVIICFLTDIGLKSQACFLQKAEIRDIFLRISDILNKNEIYLIIDSIDKASIEVASFVGKIFKELTENGLAGGIVISSVNTLDCYMQIDIITKKVIEYHLFGLSIEDTILYFRENKINFAIEDILDLHKTVGGHPISLVFLKQFGIIKSEDINQLKESSIDNAWKWLFDKVFNSLRPDEKEIILNASVFKYPFNENEIKQIIPLTYKPKYLFDSLINKDIVLSSKNSFRIHDSIRALLYDMLGNEIKESLHNKMVIYYRHDMDLSYKETDTVLNEDIFKWGYHLEQLKEGENLSIICIELLKLDEKCLDALWAIERFGFPFSFNQSNLKKANATVKLLSETGLIEKNTNNNIKYCDTMKGLILKGFDFFDSCFLHYLCLTRGISNHLGYIEIFEPNNSFEIQGIICPWEHCIEYMPLPPITKAEHEAHLKFIQEQFNRNAYDDKPPEIREQLWNELQNGVPEDAPENPDNELEAAKCPIFGHCCPAGKEQASICREDNA